MFLSGDYDDIYNRILIQKTIKILIIEMHKQLFPKIEKKKHYVIWLKIEVSRWNQSRASFDFRVSSWYGKQAVPA